MKRFIPCVLAALAVSSCSTPSPSARFELTDVNKDHRLDPNEFRTALINGRFDQLDANKDNRVSFAEWKAADPAANQATFSDRDTDRDGVVTRAEAHASARRLGTADTLFHLIDTNGDDAIQESEALAYAQKARATPSAR